MNIMFQKAVVDHAFSFQSMKYQSSTASRISHTCTSGFEYVPARKYTLSSFSLSEVEALLHVYCSLYETLPAAKVEDIPQTYQKMMTLTIYGQQFKAGQYVFAKSVIDFESNAKEEVRTVFTDPLYRPARIDHFAVHSISVGTSVYSHCFAVASWSQRHPDINYFGKPY